MSLPALPLASDRPAGAPHHPWPVLFVITSSDVGGSETMLRELVLRLDRREFAPVVCSLRPPGRIAEAIAATGTPVLTLGMSERPRVHELIAGVFRLARYLDQFEVALVQSFLYRANALTGVAARFAHRRPVVVAGQRSLYPLGGRRAALAARYTRRLCNRVVAVSEAVRRELVRTERLNPQRIVVIENGVDTARYTAARSENARAQFGFGPGTVVVGGVGRLSPEKGFNHLIDGVALARTWGVPLGLVLAGDGPERSRLEQQAQTLGLNGQARFLGVREDPRTVYAAIDVFALPSLEEGCPNALLEAMGCGRAVVAARVGAVPEIIEQGRSGLLVEPGSGLPFAQALRRLANDSPLRRRLGREAARRVREDFDISLTVEKHAALYRQLLESRDVQ
jgi:glycosyltransferase involved in cell wall biosynthesis